ncbi:MAG: hypothetical protein GQ470_02555, partial [Gammaproteobacteria bacterium]|nr:hypothetical protein [Gammaproteobacteria bacterium]
NNVTDTSGYAMTPYSDTFIYPSCAGAFPSTMCAADRYGSDLGCNSADVGITGIAVGSGSPDRCVGGDTFTVNLDVTLQFGGPSRYDIGVFISSDGLLPDTTSANGGATSCTVAVLPNPTYETSPFLDLDPGPDGSGTTDTCGDGNKADVGGGTGSDTFTMYDVVVPCKGSPLTDGGPYIPFIVSWDTQATPIGGTCTSNANPVPAGSPKCNAPNPVDAGDIALMTLDIVVMPLITIADTISAIRVGNSTEYTITVKNTTGADLNNAVLKSPVVGGLVNHVLTSCFTIDGGNGVPTCPAVNAATLAEIQDSVNGHTLLTMPVDSSIVFTISADFTSAPDPELTNSASITAVRPTAGTSATETVSDTNIILPHHYAISHASPGVTCEASAITITSHRDPGNHALTIPPSNLTKITLATSPAADSWALNSGNNPGSFSDLGSGSAEYTFDGTETSVIFWLTETTATTSPHIDIGISDNVTDNTGSNAIEDTVNEDPNIAFTDTAFRFVDTSTGAAITIEGQIGGKESSTDTTLAPLQTIGLKPIRTDNSTGECEVVFVSQTTPVGFAYECNDPTSCTANNLLSLSPESIYNAANANNKTLSAIATYTDVNLIFDASGIAPFSFIYNDVGQITLHATKTLAADANTTPPTSATTIIGNSNTFVVSPFGFYIDTDTADRATNGTGGTSYAADADGSPFILAGADFDLSFKSTLWEAADDGNGDGIPDASADLSSNSVAANFGNEQTPPDFTFSYDQTPYVTNAGTFTASATLNAASFSGGLSPTRTFNWSEVGIIDFSTEVTSYLGGTNVTTTLPNLGRFIPDHFTVSLSTNGAFANQCTTGATPYSYIGQSFGYDGAALPAYTITAWNSAATAAVTTNYNGTFAKLDLTEVTLNYPTSDAITLDEGGALIGASTTTAANNANHTITANGDGTLTFTLGGSSNTDTFLYDRANGLVPEFSASLPIQITAISETEDTDPATSLAVSATGLPFSLTPTSADNLNRFGIGDSLDSYGTQSLVGQSLAISVNTLYYNGSAWIQNIDDSCTSFSYTTTDSGITTSSTPVSPITMSSGAGDITLTIDADDATSGGSTLVEPIFPSWLRYDWGSGSYIDNPTATATFGIFRGDDRFIYWMETR